MPEWYDGDETFLPINDQEKLLELEEWADSILATDRRERGITKHSEMRDILSVGQLRNRRSREHYVKSGAPDESLVSGIFKRVYPYTRAAGLPPKNLTPEQAGKVTIRRVENGSKIHFDPEDEQA